MIESKAAYQFFVPGPPAPQPRMTRFSRFGTDASGKPSAKARAISRYLAWKETVGWTAVAAEVKPLPGFVHLELSIYVPNRRTRPWDTSNIIKAAEDALNHIAYEDDRQVASITARLYTAGIDGREEGVGFWIEAIV